MNMGENVGKDAVAISFGDGEVVDDDICMFYACHS